jgi:hypothetical protein
MLRPAHPTRRTLRKSLALLALATSLSAVLSGLAPRMALAQETEPGAEPPPEQPAPGGDWGVGGTEEEGKFAPKGKTGALKRDEEDKKEDEKAEDLRVLQPRDVGIDMVIGFGEIRDVRSNSNATDVTVVSFIPFFEWRVSETWAFGVRFPFSTGSVDGPLGDGDNYDSFALGNLEASLRATIKLKPRLRLPISLAVTLPTGQGDLYPAQDSAGAKPQALINQAASGSRGWEEQALFTPRRIGFVPTVGIRYDTRDLHFAASTKLELMIRAGGGDPESAAAGTIHNPALNWVTGASFFYDFLDGYVSPGLRAWLSVAQLPVSVGTSDYSGAQFVLEPEVTSTIPISAKLAVRAGIGYILPLGGPLGGGADATISGFRIRAGLAF